MGRLALWKYSFQLIEKVVYSTCVYRPGHIFNLHYERIKANIFKYKINTINTMIKLPNVAVPAMSSNLN